MPDARNEEIVRFLLRLVYTSTVGDYWNAIEEAGDMIEALTGENADLRTEMDVRRIAMKATAEGERCKLIQLQRLHDALREEHARLQVLLKKTIARRETDRAHVAALVQALTGMVESHDLLMFVLPDDSVARGAANSAFVRAVVRARALLDSPDLAALARTQEAQAAVLTQLANALIEDERAPTVAQADALLAYQALAALDALDAGEKP
jgi:hypothetical protein